MFGTMNEAAAALDSAIEEAERLRRFLNKDKSRQVRAKGERDQIKATALAWFNNHKPVANQRLSDADLSEVDTAYSKILSWSARNSTRSLYLSAAKTLVRLLVNLRSEVVAQKPKRGGRTSDSSPPFAPLIADAQMQQILARRWEECVVCIKANAPLAATVMMGGLLEALLLARVNREADKSAIFKAKAAPKDRKSGKTMQLKDWTLADYIDVAHELGWISVAARDVSVVLRDYRNYVHPYKELSHGVILSADDASLLWEINKSLSRQVLDSVR